MKKAASSCSWGILSQAVLGASCSKFCGVKEEAACSLTLLPFDAAEEHDKSVVPPQEVCSFSSTSMFEVGCSMLTTSSFHSTSLPCSSFDAADLPSF